MQVYIFGFSMLLQGGTSNESQQKLCGQVLTRMCFVNFNTVGCTLYCSALIQHLMFLVCDIIGTNQLNSRFVLQVSDDRHRMASKDSMSHGKNPTSEMSNKRSLANKRSLKVLTTRNLSRICRCPGLKN